MSTESERLFESFCRLHGIVYRRVAETTEQRPDYEIALAGQPMLVEIKQFDPNELERAAVDLRAGGQPVALGGKPGERLRRAIHSGKRQLRQLLAGRAMPTLLVVYNNTPCSLHMRSYALMTAMQGLDVVEVEMPSDPRESPSFGQTRSGLERGMRADAKKSTSAMAILSESDTNEPVLGVYHNRHATSGLAPDVLRLPGVVHYRLPEGAPNSVGAQWEEI